MTSTVAGIIDAGWVACDDAFGSDVESLWEPYSDFLVTRANIPDFSFKLNFDSDSDSDTETNWESQSDIERLAIAVIFGHKEHWELYRQDDPRKLAMERGFERNKEFLRNKEYLVYDREALNAMLAESVYVDEEFEVPELEDLPHLNWGPKVLKMEIAREKMWTRQRENGTLKTEQMDDEETVIDGEVESWIERDFMGLD